VLSIKAQTLPLLPPGKGGFDVQLIGRSFVPVSDVFVDGNLVQTQQKVGMWSTALQGQLAFGKRWIFTASIPLVSGASIQFPNRKSTKTGYANLETGLRYALVKPGLIDKQRFLLVSTNLVLPTPLQRQHPDGLMNGYPSYSLESGLIGGFAHKKWEVEAQTAVGLRLAEHRNYVSAFGKFSYQLRTIKPSFSLEFRQSLRDGDYFITPQQMKNGLFVDDQSYLRIHTDLALSLSRFHGLTFSIGRTLTGHHINPHWVIGLGVYAKWE
jgi:hypothetical protein